MECLMILGKLDHNRTLFSRALESLVRLRKIIFKWPNDKKVREIYKETENIPMY